MIDDATDVLIVGGGLGGVAAALAAAKLGRNVILTEEGTWLGGQLTAQGVPTDEHEWIEQFGATASYRRLRDGIRDYYRRNYPLTAAARGIVHLSPGASLVSAVSCEPKVALAVIDEMLAPFLASGKLRVFRGHSATALDWEGDTCTGVTLLDRETGGSRHITAAYVLDATELGELLELGGIEHVTGAEGQDATGEMHATGHEPRPLDMQSVTWVAALGYAPGENHVIDRPDRYDFWSTYQSPFESSPHLSWRAIDGHRFSLFGDDPEGPFSIWKYRRALYGGHFEPSAGISDIALLNAPQNDYWDSPILGIPQQDAKAALQDARQLTLSAIYWMQTDAPRPDGGTGYPGLYPRTDVFDTADGLARHIYVRESRRIAAEVTVVEEHIGVDARPGADSAHHFEDSVGIGAYRLDLHSTSGGFAGLNLPAYPFQIPLGALLPVRVDNVLPACKNIGATQITNGAMRLHPIEWNIGESVGALAAFCLAEKVSPRQVRADARLFADYQRTLHRLGIETEWPKVGAARSYYKAHSSDTDWDWGQTNPLTRGTVG